MHGGNLKLIDIRVHYSQG